MRLRIRLRKLPSKPLITAIVMVNAATPIITPIAVKKVVIEMKVDLRRERR